jgi:PAS domain S-box-containing protein
MELSTSTGQKTNDAAVAGFPGILEGVARAITADAVFVVDPECHIVYWDARAESLTGLLAEEMVGEHCYDVLSGEGEDGTSFCARVCSAVRLARAGQPASGYEVRVFTRSGGERWVGVSSLAVPTKGGPYLISLMRDVWAEHETLEMARHLVRLSHQGAHEESAARRHQDAPALTPRQAEILGLLASGKSAGEIGRELYLSQATVRNHIRALLLALGAHSQLEALARAREAGLLDG